MEMVKLNFILCFICALSRSEMAQNSSAQPVNQTVNQPSQTVNQTASQPVKQPDPVQPKPDLSQITFRYDNKEFKPVDSSIDLSESFPYSFLTFTPDEIDHLTSKLIRENVSISGQSSIYIYAQIYPVGEGFGLFRFRIPTAKPKLDIEIIYCDFLSLPTFFFNLRELFNINRLNYHYDFVAALMFCTFLPIDKQNEENSQFYYNLVHFLALCPNTKFVDKIIKNIPKGNRREVVKKITDMIDNIIRKENITNLETLGGIKKNRDAISWYTSYTGV